MLLRLKGSAAKRSKLNGGHAEEHATVSGGGGGGVSTLR